MNNSITVSTNDNTNNKLNVSSNGTSGKVGVTADTAQYWSQKSKEWAISGELVDREDYSSKYYAKKSKESADIATTTKNDIEASKTEFDNTYNEKSQALNNQYTNYSSELTTQKTEAITDIENKTEGLTDLYNEYTQNITTQETQAIQNITDKETESIANIETSAQTEIGKINSAGSTQITDIQDLTTTSKTEIQIEGERQLANIQETGIDTKADEQDLDGHWTEKHLALVLNANYPTGTNTVIDLSAVLPKDNNVYEIILEADVETGAKSGNYCNCVVSTSLITTSVVSCRTRTNSTVQVNSSATIPLGADKKLTVRANSSYVGKYTLAICAYRKVR